MIKLPDYFDNLVEQARARAEKAMVKFPQPNYVLNKVAEESGEVIKAVIHYTEGRETWVNVEAELIDNLAMLIRLVKEGDQVIGFTPPTEVQRLNATVQIDVIERESMKNLKWLFDLSKTCHALGIPLRISDSQVEKIAEAFLELEQRLNAIAQPVSDGREIAQKVLVALRRHGLQEEFARIAYEVVVDSYPAAPGGQND